MKKTLWMLGVAVTALTSCTQSEVVDVPESKQIRFEEFVEKNSRATVADDAYDLTTAKLTNYWVYGYTTDEVNGTGTQQDPYVGDFTDAEEVFEGMEMSYSNSKWNYEATDKWKTNHLYRFAAYSNGNKELNGVTYDPDDDELTITDYTVIDNSEIIVDDPATTNVDETVQPLDLVASIAGDRHASSNDQPVSFTFRHLLAKVTFHFTNNSNSANLHFTNIKIEDIAKQGTCVCTYATSTLTGFPRNVVWSDYGSEVDFAFADVNVPYVNGIATSDEVTLYLIPQSNTGKRVTMTLFEKINEESYNTEDLSFVLTTDTYHTLEPGDMVSGTWVAGYHYRYLITKGTEFNQIQFEATVSDWDKDRDGNGNPGENNDYVTPQS